MQTERNLNQEAFPAPLNIRSRDLNPRVGERIALLPNVTVEALPAKNVEATGWASKLFFAAVVVANVSGVFTLLSASQMFAPTRSTPAPITIQIEEPKVVPAPTARSMKVDGPHSLISADTKARHARIVERAGKILAQVQK